jgi:predicted ATPase
MKIVEFTAKKLHGYLTFGLRYNADLTFLTGINGSGKTSAVRAMTALLTPSLNSLAGMTYELISVTVERGGEEVTILSNSNADDLLLGCRSVTLPEEWISIPILKSDAFESTQHFEERRTSYYGEQEAANAKHRVLQQIRELPTPMFLDLERRYQDGARGRRTTNRVGVRAGMAANPLGGTLTESLTYAQALAEDAYRDFLVSRSQLADRLKQELILSAFRPTKGEHELSSWNQRPQFLDNLQRTERVVISSLTQIDIPPEQISKSVIPFFEHVRRTASNLPAEPNITKGRLTPEEISVFSDWSALQPQVQQINLIANRIGAYNRELTNNFSILEHYLKSVNTFLSDSAKQLAFDPRGNLRIHVEGDDRPRDINALSSGERQIVVILTHLAFNRLAKRANILIIDEPELSLHLRWQELFVDAVIGASPGLQLILATHSPAIIKGRIGNCIDIREDSKDARACSR